MERDRFLSRARGSILAAAAADALGALTEFPSRVALPGSAEEAKIRRSLAPLSIEGRVRTFQARNRRLLRGMFTDPMEPGAYTDDTQLAIAVSRSIDADGCFDGHRFGALEFPEWLSFERGAGTTTRAAAEAMRKKSACWNRNFFTVREWKMDSRRGDGNGAAMRVGPIALARSRDPEGLARDAWHQAIVSHQHPRGIIAAHAQAVAVACALEEAVEPGRGFLAAVVRRLADELRVPADPAIEEFVQAWDSEGGRGFQATFDAERKSYLERARSLDRLPGDPTGALLALGSFGSKKAEGARSALAALYLAGTHGESLGDLIVTAANLIGSDTDTVGCMAAAIAGAIHGDEAIPESLRAVQDAAFLRRLGDHLGSLALREGPRLDFTPPDLAGASPVEADALSRGDPILHGLYGPATVTRVIGPKTVGRTTLTQLGLQIAGGPWINLLSTRKRSGLFVATRGPS